MMLAAKEQQQQQQQQQPRKLLQRQLQQQARPHLDNQRSPRQSQRTATMCATTQRTGRKLAIAALHITVNVPVLWGDQDTALMAQGFAPKKGNAVKVYVIWTRVVNKFPSKYALFV